MFEKIINIDNSKEADGPREKHYSIELTDKEYMQRLQAARFVYKPAILENLTPQLQEKYKKALELTKETKVVKLKQGKKNVRKTSDAPKKTAKKNNTKPNASAMETV